METLGDKVVNHDIRISLLEQSDKVQSQSLKEIKGDLKEVVKLTQEIKTTTCSQIPALQAEIENHKRTHKAVNNVAHKLDKKWMGILATGLTLLFGIMTFFTQLIIMRWEN